MKLRYFFDWSGDYLWSADEQAHDRFGYPADVDRMPFSAETRKMAREIGGLFVEFSGMTDGDQRAKREAEFRTAGEALYERIVAELGPDFTVLNEL